MAYERAWFEVLGVSPLATDEEVRAAYIRLVKLWHPDQYLGNPELERRAHRRLSEINAAYDLVKGRASSVYGGSQPGSASSDPAYDPSDPHIWSPPASDWLDPDDDGSTGPMLLFPRKSWIVRAFAFLLALLFTLGTIVDQMRAIGGRQEGARATGRPAPSGAPAQR